MKKLICLLTAILMLAALVGCGADEETNGKKSNGAGGSPVSDGLNLSILPAQTICVHQDCVGAVRNEGTVSLYCDQASSVWGTETWTNITSMQFYYGSKVIALRADGTVFVAEGTHESGSLVWYAEELEWTDIVAVSTDWRAHYGLRSDGTVVTTELSTEEDGFNAAYPEGYTVDKWTNIVKICEGNSVWGQLLVGLKADGTVVMAGTKEEIALHEDVMDWRGIVDIDAFDGSIIGLRKDGTVVFSKDWGDIDVSDWTDIVAVATGSNHVVGLKSDGTVVTAGDNTDSQCNTQDWTDIVAIDAGPYETIGLKSDGTLVVAGRERVVKNTNWDNLRLPLIDKNQ